jgi:hypothetical protein
MSIPSLQLSPSSLLATQWKLLFDNGFTTVVTLSMSSSVGFAVLAGLTHVSKGALMQRNLYIGAAVAALGLAPYTKILMGTNIETLETRAKEGKGEGEDDTHALVAMWGKNNLWRGVMLLSSGAMGALAALF